MASSLTIDIQANTDPVVRKLRAIAEHCTALAAELEAIDAEAVDTGGGVLSLEQRQAADERRRHGRRED